MKQNESKQKKVEPEVLADDPTPLTNSQKTTYSIPREELIMLRYGLCMKTYEEIDEAICALAAVEDLIKSNTKTYDVRTRGMIVCIGAHLEAVRDVMRSSWSRMVEAFNKCFPVDGLSI